jgi:hypothetical protein
MKEPRITSATRLLIKISVHGADMHEVREREKMQVVL